jgi:hypothetical protein
MDFTDTLLPQSRQPAEMSAPAPQKNAAPASTRPLYFFCDFNGLQSLRELVRRLR